MLAETGPLSLNVDLDGDVAVIGVAGELDVSTSALLRECLIALTDVPDVPAKVLLDLRELAFVDSTGLGAMVAGLKRLREAGSDLVLRSPPPAALKVITITGLDKVFAIEA
jgi:anti-sigma B factor antagonist